MTRWTDRDDDDRALDLLVEQTEQEDDAHDQGPLFPLRLAQGEDGMVTEAVTDHERGRWSAEELGMHLVEEQ
jgi:hypothetical protein